MTRYLISNISSGLALGVYEADSKAEALDAMARDMGYEDYDDACSVAGIAPLSVEAVTE